MKNQEYWQECISIAAEECDLTLTKEQLKCLADAAESGHDCYGMAFYSPPIGDRMRDIEDGWKKKLKDLQAEYDAYRRNAEVAVKQALRAYPDDTVTIHEDGEVLRHGGRTERIQ